VNSNACRTPDEIVHYIVAHHHAFVRVAVPRITKLTQAVLVTHGEHHPEIRDVADVFDRLADQLLQHMAREEEILFPWIVYTYRQGWHTPHALFGTVINPIMVMEREHEAALESMSLIRELTDDYVPPPDACPSYRAWLHELEGFETDLRAHVLLEDDILFPAAARLERSAS
jgi:regulator of cell morphogenesis and NO signaling